MSANKRPLSPFMIGPYYRPQLTSMMSIAHRATGVLLAAGSLGLLYVLLALAADEAAFASARACLASPLGRVATLAFCAALMYHLFNGIRHLAWDAGKGFALPDVYRSGYAVIVLTVLSTAGLWWLALRSGGAA